jgi:hypothetical protein
MPNWVVLPLVVVTAHMASVFFGSRTPCLHGSLLCNIRTCAGHPYWREPFTGYYSWWSVSFSTPFSSSQKINYNWHGDTIGIRSSGACCKSWVCWLIELHTFSLLSPGVIQFLGCYWLSGEKCSGKMRGDSFLKLWCWQLSPHRASSVSSCRAQTFFLSVSLYPSTLKSFDLRLWHIFLSRRFCRVSSAKIHLMIVTLRAKQYCYYFPILSLTRMPQFWQRIGMLAL